MAKAYFTFCYNGVPTDRGPAWNRDEFQGPKFDEDEILEYLHKYAFVVETNEPDVTFAELSRESLFRRLLGPVLYGWYAKDRLVIGSKPDMAPELFNSDPLDVLRVKTKDGGIYKLSVRELERMCTSAIKYGLGCTTCQHYAPSNPGDCYLRQIVAHTKSLNWRSRVFVPPEEAPADSFCPEDLHKFLVKAVKNGYKLSNGYKYLSPKLTREQLVVPPKECGGVPYLRYYDNHVLDISTVEDNREAASSRARATAQTKRNEKRCTNECIFAPCGYFCTKSSRSWVTHCREGFSGGPFSKERTAQLYGAWVRSFPRRRSLEEISLIVYNAGDSTRIFGYEMILAGFDPGLEYVQFVHPTGKHWKYFRYEDALEIMRTPWRHDGAYSKMPIMWDPPILSEEQLWTYAEIRQKTETPGYAYYCGWATPQILWVDWHGTSFTIHTHCGWDRYVDGVTGAAKLFGVRNTIQSGAKLQALEAEVHQESNQGTQP